MAQVREGETTMAKNVVKQIRKATRRRFSAEEKIRIVLKGLLFEPVAAAARNCRLPGDPLQKELNRKGLDYCSQLNVSRSSNPALRIARGSPGQTSLQW
jgi:hypothetical protein